MSGITRLRAMVVALMVVLISGSGAIANAEETKFTTITTVELKALLDGKKDLLLVDTRTVEEYQEAHIAQAVSIPEKVFEEKAALLPADKVGLIVLYCNGVKCGKSRKAAKKAEAMGYRNVLVYAEGFPVWEEKGLAIIAGPEYAKKIETTRIKPAELKKLLDSAPAGLVLVDVRDEDEFREGHIPTAINIPVETFASRSEILPKEKKIVVYCNSGGRSYNAYRKLMKLGYTSIAQTLYADWKAAGMGVVR